MTKQLNQQSAKSVNHYRDKSVNRYFVEVSISSDSIKGHFYQQVIASGYTRAVRRVKNSFNAKGARDKEITVEKIFLLEKLK